MKSKLILGLVAVLSVLAGVTMLTAQRMGGGVTPQSQPAQVVSGEVQGNKVQVTRGPGKPLVIYDITTKSLSAGAADTVYVDASYAGGYFSWYDQISATITTGLLLSCSNLSADTVAVGIARDNLTNEEGALWLLDGAAATIVPKNVSGLFVTSNAPTAILGSTWRVIITRDNYGAAFNAKIRIVALAN